MVWELEYFQIDLTLLNVNDFLCYHVEKMGRSGKTLEYSWNFTAVFFTVVF